MSIRQQQTLLVILIIGQHHLPNYPIKSHQEAPQSTIPNQRANQGYQEEISALSTGQEVWLMAQVQPGMKPGHYCTALS
jgi:hypothetical protein